jgi:formylglycine-generating enzyme required for sulfatase activity
VIRLDKLPPNIASVLGRMLEEDPADRFSSATEFKQALTSAATSVIVAPVKELTSGVCPACNSVNADNRKFCGECAESLRTVCLDCDIEMAVWDKICGECGGRQTDLRQQATEKSVTEMAAMEKPAAEMAAILAGDSITNTIGMTLKEIPAGTFIMGSPGDETDREDHEHQHKVTISKSFYMQTTQVTQGQWKYVMDTEPWTGWFFNKSYVKKGTDYPATYVRWDEAVAYCRKLSTKEGKTYRLPTEAEWEYACRAGTETAWSFGDDEKVLGDYAWYKENAYDIVSEQYPHQVGLKKPNAFGLYDMHGNVWEWCHDYFREDYYKQSPEQDPQCPASGSSRVLRGGSWDNSTRGTRSAYRGWAGAVSRVNNFGFRLVRELD